MQCGLAVTLDFWTDDYHKNPYLAITGHFIDDKWELKDTLIGVFPWDVNLRQTFETIPTFLYEVYKYYFTLLCHITDKMLVHFRNWTLSV